MKILVVSDTHGDIRNLSFVLRHVGAIDLIVHCGDGVGDIDRARATGAPVSAFVEVRGNTDMDHRTPHIAHIALEGSVALVSHGNRACSSGSFLSLVYAAREAGAAAYFFGHTHIPYHEIRDGVLLLNPGSLSRPRSAHGPTFSLVEATGTTLLAKFFELTGDVRDRSIRELAL